MVNVKINKGLPPLIRPKLSKKSKEKWDEIKNHINLRGFEIIVNSHYIGTILNGSIQEVKSKRKSLFSFFETNINKADIISLG